MNPALKYLAPPARVDAIEQDPLGGANRVERGARGLGEFHRGQLLVDAIPQRSCCRLERREVGEPRERGTGRVPGRRELAHAVLGVARDSLLPELEAEVLVVVGRHQCLERALRVEVRAERRGRRRARLLRERLVKTRAHHRELRLDLRLVVRKREVQHPASLLVAPREAEGFHSRIVARLRVLHLMEVLVEQCQHPPGRGLRGGVRGLADDDGRKGGDGWKTGEQVDVELPRARPHGRAEYRHVRLTREVRRGRRVADQELPIGGHKQHREGRRTPTWPELVAEGVGQAERLGDADAIGLTKRRELRRALGAGRRRGEDEQ